MAKITKLELEQLLASQAEQLRAARQRVGELEVNLEIANKRIAQGHELVRSLRKEIAAAGKPQVIIKRMTATPVPVVTRFYRGGQLWEKTRVGNKSTERLVNAPGEDKLAALVEKFS